MTKPIMTRDNYMSAADMADVVGVRIESSMFRSWQIDGLGRNTELTAAEQIYLLFGLRKIADTLERWEGVND